MASGMIIKEQAFIKSYIRQIQYAKGGISMSVKRIKKNIKKTAKAGKKAAWVVAFTAVAMVACPVAKILIDADDD